MRTLLTVHIPTAQGNAAFKSGLLKKTLAAFMDEKKPEAAYFTVSPEGERCTYMVFDLPDPSAMVAIAEPLFANFEARVTMQPVMNIADLTAGLEAAERALAAAV